MSSIPPDEDTLPAALAQAWRVDEPSTAELRRGYARFVRGQRRTVRMPLFARWLVGGMVLGLGLAQAASAVQVRWLSPRELPAPPLPPARVAAPTGRIAGPIPAVSSSTKPDDSSAQPLNPQPGLPHRATREASKPEVQEQWQRAAAALRENDFVRAQQALLEVERRADGAERDAAELARAQLLASNGRANEALTLASELQVHAQTPLVREKARALAARLSKNASADRSNQPAAAVNQP